MRKVNKINIPSLDKARLRNKDSLTFVYSSEIDENLKSRFENKKFFISRGIGNFLCRDMSRGITKISQTQKLRELKYRKPKN